LQGIKGSARVQLLALSLAALEQQISGLPPRAALALQGAQQWRDVCIALVANASLAAVAAWLGYVPEELQEAVRLQFDSLDPSTLAVAGVSCPAGYSRPAGAAEDASSSPAHSEGAFPSGWLRKKRRRKQEDKAGSSSTGSGSSGREAATGLSSGSGNSSSSPGQGGTRAVSRKTRIESFYWVGLEERLGLYSSVLRLLRSQSIVQHAAQQRGQGQDGWEGQGDVEAAGRQLPPPQRQQQQQQQQPSDGSGAPLGSCTQGESPQQESQSKQPEAPSATAGTGVSQQDSTSSPTEAALATARGSNGGGAVEARQAARSSLQNAVSLAGLRCGSLPLCCDMELELEYIVYAAGVTARNISPRQLGYAKLMAVTVCWPACMSVSLVCFCSAQRALHPL
jgi:hypothetical protein